MRIERPKTLLAGNLNAIIPPGIIEIRYPQKKAESTKLRVETVQFVKDISLCC